MPPYLHNYLSGINLFVSKQLTSSRASLTTSLSILKHLYFGKVLFNADEMSIRCIWIVSVLPESFGKVLFYRKFPTAERKAQLSYGENYVVIPSEKEFSIALLSALGLSHDSKQFISWRDKANKDMHLPVITIKIKEKELWPLLIVEQPNYLLCCLPYVESKTSKDLFQVPSVSMGFSALIGISNFLSSLGAVLEEQSQSFVQLDNYLTVSMPFGEPSDTECASIMALYSIPSSGKGGARKQTPQKGKASINIEVNEFVRSSQSDAQSFEPIVEVYGNITLKLENLGQINELSLTLEHVNCAKSLNMESIAIHPCVQTFIPDRSLDSCLPKKFWLIPVLKNFPLCFYTVNFPQPPISGVFKLKGKSLVELYIQLKLNENIKNSFSSCEVFIPFFQRGTVSNFEFKVTQGFLHVSEDKRSLKWNVGSKFSTKTLDAFLTAKVTLKSSQKVAQGDPFCVDQNAYVQIHFRQNNETLSGCSIDGKSVAVSPHQKFKVFAEYTVQSTEYRIWNSLGDLPFPVMPVGELFPNRMMQTH